MVGDSGDTPSLRAVQVSIDQARQEVIELRRSISGSELTGPGILARVAVLEDKVRHLKEVQDNAIRNDARDREEENRQAKRRDRFVVAALATLSAIVSGLVLAWLAGGTGIVS